MSMFSSITDTAGNTGSQSAATLIRAIALGDVAKENYGKAMLKEFTVSSVIGFAAMIVSFLRIIVI
jgi:magnesium transporter